MINKISESLTDVLVKKEVISKDEYEIYQFGIDCFIMKSIHIISYFILALIFHKLPELAVFLIAFIPLREYAGGYHAKTSLKCYFVSCIAVISYLILISYINQDIFIYSYIIAIVASILILLIAPVETSNKPLDEKEKTVFKKRACLLTVVELSLVILLWVTKFYQMSFIISIGLFYVLCIAFIGIASNLMNKMRKN